MAPKAKSSQVKERVKKRVREEGGFERGTCGADMDKDA